MPATTTTTIEDAPLRIFLVQSAVGLHASSGGYRANLALCRSLVAQGHEVKMLAFPHAKDLETVSHKKDASRRFGSTEVAVSRFSFKGIEVVGLNADAYSSVFDNPDFLEQYTAWLENEAEPDECSERQRFIHDEIRSFEPTHFIMNERGSLRIAMDESNRLPCKCARIFVAHDVNNLPFGPFSATGDAEAQHERLRNVEGLWTVSKAVQAYFVQFGRLDNAKVLPCHPMIYGDHPEDLPYYDNWDKAHVTMINPGPAKGYPIAHALARLAPDVNFLVIKSWSMQEYVCNSFEELSNVTLEESYKNMEDLWKRTKVLVVPSVCYEAFGLVVVEALLRGIVVISSDAGGLPEAHLNVPWVLPVSPITEEETDQTLIDRFGRWKLPENDPEPWVLTLHSVLWDKELYEATRKQGREAALAYLEEIGSGQYESWFREMSRKLNSSE